MILIQTIFSFFVSCNLLLAMSPFDLLNPRYVNLYAMNKKNPMEAALYVCKIAEDSIKLAKKIAKTSEGSCELRKLEEMLAKVESLEYTEDETVEIGNIFREYREQVLSGHMISRASKTACEELKKVFDLAKKKDKRDFLSNIDTNSFTRYPALLVKSLMHGVAYTLDSICNVPVAILKLILKYGEDKDRFSFFEEILENSCISKKDLGSMYTQTVARTVHGLPSLFTLKYLSGTMPACKFSNILSDMFTMYSYNRFIYPLFTSLKDSFNCSDSTFEMAHSLALLAWFNH